MAKTEGALAGVLLVAVLITILRQLTLVQDLARGVDRTVEDARSRV